jgi:hypothetical protein
MSEEATKTFDSYLKTMVEAHKEIVDIVETHGVAYVLVAAGVLLVFGALVLAGLSRLTETEAVIFGTVSLLFVLIGAAIAHGDRKSGVQAIEKLQTKTDESLKLVLDFMKGQQEMMQRTATKRT